MFFALFAGGAFLAFRPGFSILGRGATLYLAYSGQNSRICSKRYHCLPGVSPRGVMIGGSWQAAGDHDEDFVSTNCIS